MRNQVDKMRFSRIFDVFSLRKRPEETISHEVPESLRNKVFFLCSDVFSNRLSDRLSAYETAGDYRAEFWEEIHRFLQYRHGRPQLEVSVRSRGRSQDVIAFLLNCKPEEFLDFIEYIFRVECLFHVELDENEIVEGINALLESENAPYYVTEMIRERVKTTFHGRETDAIQIVQYPHVIMKESVALHALAMEPVLTLLQQPEYKAANDEFLEALEDYRNSDFGDSLTKCASSLESVMKVICRRRGWPYKPTDTASSLVKTIIANTNLENYFEQMLIIVATLRNRLSKAHGGGVQPRKAPKHLAQYALNATAAAILLLVEETK